MKLLITILLALTVFASNAAVGSSSGAQNFEEAVQGSLSLDYSVYNNADEFFINIISEDGYKICDGKVSKSNLEQINCVYDKDIFKSGDNKFFVTVYSIKKSNIVLQTSGQFYNDEDSSFQDSVIKFLRNKNTWLAVLILGTTRISYPYIAKLFQHTNSDDSDKGDNDEPPKPTISSCPLVPPQPTTRYPFSLEGAKRLVTSRRVQYIGGIALGLIFAAHRVRYAGRLKKIGISNANYPALVAKSHELPATYPSQSVLHFDGTQPAFVAFTRPTRSSARLSHLFSKKGRSSKSTVVL